jgi:hypothetical protein
VRPLDARNVEGLLAQGGTVLGTHNRCDPFHYFGAGGADCSAQAMAYARELGLDALVAIGGDGTMAIAHRFECAGLPMVGVPKTIDNDLCHTERTFGFDSAVAVVAEALDRLETTARSHGRVMIAETMGRYAGWIALEGGMAGGADVILLPELPVDVDAVAPSAARASARGLHADLHRRGRAPAGRDDGARRIADSPDPLRLGGVGNLLAAPAVAAAGQRGAHHAAGPCAARRLAHALRPRAGHALRLPRGANWCAGPLRPHGHAAGRHHRQRGDQRGGRPQPHVPPTTVAGGAGDRCSGSERAAALLISTASARGCVASQSARRRAAAGASARSCDQALNAAPRSVARAANAASVRRAMASTWWPGCSNCAAMARPRPRDAPVTMKSFMAGSLAEVLTV